MLFNLIAFLTRRPERTGSSVVRKLVVLEPRELAGKGLEQNMEVGEFSQIGNSRTTLYEGIREHHQRLEEH